MKWVLMLFYYFGLSQANILQEDDNLDFNLSLTVKTQSSVLLEDFLDLVSLIDIDKAEDVIQYHLEADGGLAVVIKYLQGTKWKYLANQISNIEGVQELIVYLELKDIPVSQFLDSIAEAIDETTPGAEPDTNGSLRPFLDKIEATIPFTDVAVTINNKLQNSPAFQRLYVLLSGERYLDVVTEIRLLPEIKRLEERLRDFDVKVDEGLKIMYNFFAWGTPKV